MLFIGPLFATGTFVNFVAISYNAANALPFGTIVVIIMILSLVGFPLVAIVGHRRPQQRVSGAALRRAALLCNVQHVLLYCTCCAARSTFCCAAAILRCFAACSAALQHVALRLQVVVGGIAGRNLATPFEAPCRTTKVPREIPPLPWYRQPAYQVVMAGFLPFSAISMYLSR